MRGTDEDSSSLNRIESGLMDMRLDSVKNGQSLPFSNEEGSLEAIKPAKDGPGSSREPATELSFANKSATMQSALADPDDFRQSPTWLSPIVNMPSAKCKAYISNIPLDYHAQLADIVFSNCRTACFEFYRASGLWRTQHDGKDWERKLFQLDNDRFPESPDDLSLRHWLAKIRRAGSTQVEDYGSVLARDVYDWKGAVESFKEIPKIPSLLDPFGRIDTDVFEECLVTSMRLWSHLQAWDAFGRLKFLWKDVHTQSSCNDEHTAAGFQKLKPKSETLIKLRTAQMM